MSKHKNSLFKPNPSVWDVAPPGVSLELAKWSADHFQRHGRPLRLAIDAHYWQDHFDNDFKVDWLRKNSREVNAVEKTVMYQIMTLLELSIHLIFVFDGPDRYNQHDLDSKPSKPESICLLKDLLNHLGVPFHQAPAEAAPACVKLQQLGVVDSVWTNHSVALTCGCREIVLFKEQHRHWKGAGISDESVTKHDALALLQKWDLDQSSLVLALLLGGCEYSRGLPGWLVSVIYAGPKDVGVSSIRIPS
ncbi:PIN domain-like protein [Neurospora tetraspora]|uniref:PIN domain-like protein n=1 Tax=Neurospora tetraspora TaxID=94610 RepID=A0AAE0JNK8_9PEZI|nr:PIN domain-like protein [Neurospora tetraspora]